MPTISMFYGLVIQMFWNDHGSPHFHVRFMRSMKPSLIFASCASCAANYRGARWRWYWSGRPSTATS
jgi:hypothetical protein